MAWVISAPTSGAPWPGSTDCKSSPRERPRADLSRSVKSAGAAKRPRRRRHDRTDRQAGIDAQHRAARGHRRIARLARIRVGCDLRLAGTAPVTRLRAGPEGFEDRILVAGD